MTTQTAMPLFYTYTGGEFQKADVSRFFGGYAKTNDQIVAAIQHQGCESMTRQEVYAGELKFSLWEGPDHQCVVCITTEGVPPHIIYLNGLLNWLQFQGAILSPAFQLAKLVHGDA